MATGYMCNSCSKIIIPGGGPLTIVNHTVNAQNFYCNSCTEKRSSSPSVYIFDEEPIFDPIFSRFEILDL